LNLNQAGTDRDGQTFSKAIIFDAFGFKVYPYLITYTLAHHRRCSETKA